MPNYRKWQQQQKRTKNKNKSNKSHQQTSSLKQESSELIVQLDTDTVGIEPNLPADITATTTSTIYTASTSSCSSTYKHVSSEPVKGISDSSPLNNEEIDENACNVDIDAHTAKAVQIQSNYSSSSSSQTISTSASTLSALEKSTDIEARSQELVSNENFEITDRRQFEADSNKNNSKTGSTHSKDVAASTAVSHTITRSGDNTPNTGQRHASSTSSQPHHPTSEQSQSKVIVHQVCLDNPSSQTTTEQNVIHDSTSPTLSKVIVNKVEESTTTSHTAYKKDSSQPKVITSKSAKKKAIRSNTSSLHKSFDDDPQPSKVIVQQISKEDDESTQIHSTVKNDQPSKVIVHPILLEGSDEPIHSQVKISEVVNGSKEDRENISQESKVIVHEISPERELINQHISSPIIVSSHILREKSNLFGNSQEENGSKVIVHRISQEPNTPSATATALQKPNLINSQVLKEESTPTKPVEKGQEPKVIVHQISLEHAVQADAQTSEVIAKQILKGESTLTGSSEEDKASTVIVHQTSQEPSTTSAAQPGTQASQPSIPASDVIAKQILKEKSTLTESSVEGKTSRVIVHQISQEPSTASPAQPDTQASSAIATQILQEGSTATESSEEDKTSKVIVHQILQEPANASAAQPGTQASEAIAKQTLKDRSTATESSEEGKTSRVIVHQISQEPSTALPAQPDTQAPSAIATQILQEGSTATESSEEGKTSRVIVHQISPEPLTISPAQPNTQEPNIIVNQIFKDISTSKESVQSSLIPTPETVIESNVIVQHASHEKSFISKESESKVIVHQASQKESVPPTAKGSVSIATEISQKESIPVPESPKQPKVIVHQISKETSGHPTISQQAPAHPIVSETPVDAKLTVYSVLKESQTEGHSQRLEELTKSCDTVDYVPNIKLIPKTQEDLIRNIPQQSPSKAKERLIPILVENETQTSASLPTTPEIKLDKSSSKDDPFANVIFEQLSIEKSLSSSSSSQTEEDESGPLSRVIVQPIQQQLPKTPGINTSTIGHPTLKVLIPNKNDRTHSTSPQKTAFPVLRSPKVIVHQVNRENSKPVFPLTAQSLKKLDDSSNKLVHTILKDVSSELKTSFRTEQLKKILKDPPEEPVRTTFPLSEEKKLTTFSLTQSSPEQIKAKVITHQISREEPKISQENPKQEEIPPKAAGQSGSEIVSREENQSQPIVQCDPKSGLVSVEPPICTSEIPARDESEPQVIAEPNPQSSTPKVHVHQIHKEEAPISTVSTLSSETDLKPDTIERQLSNSSTSSSDESVRTTIQVKSPQALSPSVDTDQDKLNKSPFTQNPAEPVANEKASIQAKEMSSKIPQDQSSKVIVHQITVESPTDQAAPVPLEVQSPNITDQPIVPEKTPSDSARTIVHPIIRESLGYRVESPQPERKTMIVKKSKSFDENELLIQEISDASSSSDTVNTPVISEAESETDTIEGADEFADTQINSRILSVQTLPIDYEDGLNSSKTNKDYRVRRQQNRVAIETHFLPQFLSPMYLDSIKEENSDLSDSDRRSECSDRCDHPKQQTDLENDVPSDGGPHAKKADAVFPKSNLDFSKKHKHIHTNVRLPKTTVIREEAPPPSVVEAKLVDLQTSVDESRSSWSTDCTPESEAAEVVYIDSASSSASDLLELDYSQGQSDESIDVRIQTPTIGFESVNEMFANQQGENNDTLTPHHHSPSPPLPPLPPVKEEEKFSRETHTQPFLTTDSEEQTITSSSEITITETSKTTTNTSRVEILKTSPDEIILEKIETMSAPAACASTNDHDGGDVSTTGADRTDRAQDSKANKPNSCDSAIVDERLPSSTVAGQSEKMDQLREIVNESVQSELNTITDTDHVIAKPNFKIGEPCSDHTLKSESVTSLSSPIMPSPSSTATTTITTDTANTVSTTCATQILTLHDLSKTLSNTALQHPLDASVSPTLNRQESLDSHGSDQSQSTNQSQCTAINQGSLPHTDWNEVDTTTDTTYVSGSDTAGLASSENSSPITTGEDTDTEPIRKLRSLCTEALASMPYGEDVLEELATVARNIGDMPYPLPDLPHIRDIQVSTQSKAQPTSSVINLAQVPPKSTSVGQKLRSPPPPPVPAAPAHYDSWLGVPTERDPNVLVCLSPSQQSAVKSETTPDSLLDMHKKFVERRGYHELTTQQVDAINREKSYETVTLSKSNSPPPPPLPPRPQQASAHTPPPVPPSKSAPPPQAPTSDDQNNHRLLAIIRDTHDSQQQQQPPSSSENISRRTTESASNNITISSSTIMDTTPQRLGDLEKFANSPSVSKQTQERSVSESNKSQSAHETMQTQTSERNVHFDREPVLGLRFPTSEYFDNIFGKTNKRFSNIETQSSPGFCSQIRSTQPKRYSNVETSSFESRKCVENGKVLYDVNNSSREKVSDGEKPDSVKLTSFPQVQPTKPTEGFGSFPTVTPTAATPGQADSRPQAADSENIMSAFKLNAQSAPTPAARTESSPPAPPVPPLPPSFVDSTATTTTTKSSSTSESTINRTFNGEAKGTIFDESRHRAKEAATDVSSQPSGVFDPEKLIKDFDELSKLLRNELESGKRRPPATLDGAEIPANVSDYNQMARESRTQTSQTSSTTTTESARREQMKKLADEIDRTSAQRLQNRREMRIPIRIEKATPTPPRSAPVTLERPHSYEIPVPAEKPAMHSQGTDTTDSRPQYQQQRSYEIPIRVEGRPRTNSLHHVEQRSQEAPIDTGRPRENPDRFRRAESMFNISDDHFQRQMLRDDWMKYVDDLGSSENICKPFQREVEICYLGRRPNIRAPRISASTSDLSNTHSYDTYGAYDVRRTATPQPQQPPRRFLSTQSMIDTTPITSCVSSRRSQKPERRSSLPRELHEKQFNEISSKEQRLRLEFERLENERQQLIDEMNRVKMNQRLSREAYRQRQLPPLSEDENFRQQMAEEWLHKVAEREERRLQKIIKISKVNQDNNFPVAPPRRVSSSDIGDEFLRRVKERRSKLHMPSDSDWESGAESQPMPRADGSRSETDDPPPVTVLEGRAQADIKQLPKHLREFAKLASQLQEEHREEVTENTSCTATKKSSITTSVKTTTNAEADASNSQQQQSTSHQSLLSDAARVGELEQLSTSKRQKPVTILRHRKPAESGSSSTDHLAILGTESRGVVASSTANPIKRRKQTRFLLTPNRRSWSESDLLREIDKDLVLAKGFLYANGVWTPKNQTPSSSRTNLNNSQPQSTESLNSNSNSPATNNITANPSKPSSNCVPDNQEKGIPTPPPLPLWTPQPERKQFRPIHFESPKPQRKYIVRQQSTPSDAAAPPPWSYTNFPPFPGYQSQSCTNLNQKNQPGATAFPWPPPQNRPPAANGTCCSGERVHDEDEYTPTSSIAEKIKSFERSTSNTEIHRPFVRLNPHEKPAILRPNEVIYSVKNEYMSEPETEYEKPKKMAQLSRRQYEGIGPTTRDGMPVVLRSEVKEPNQHEWYKRIFHTIHKQKNPGDYVTIRYKCPRGRYPYKSNGYMSEPEPNYDSDYSTVKYRTLERRRLQSNAGPPQPSAGNDSQDGIVYGTMPNPVKSSQGSYKVQPGRIEDYITGHSSVSEKEKKEWWDEVMDIFNGWLKDNDRLPRIFIEFANEVERFQLDQQKLSPHYTEGNLSRALLKEQGYTSDSNLVFRKRDAPQQSPLSPVEQKQYYKSVQSGGQPPLLGFRKPAPEKPKETEFEYLPITSTLTKIRVHSKNTMPTKSQTTQRELINSPITNIPRPIDIFAPFPKDVPSFIPMHQPPLPPNRKSSRSRTTSMTWKISASQVRRPTSANSSRHEACFQTKDAISPPPPIKPTKFGTIHLRKTIKPTESLARSKSTGAVVSVLAAAKEEEISDGRISRKQRSIRLSSSSPVRSASKLSTYRASSRSPVAFGRSVSKERSFAEEKKRIEEFLPSIRADFTGSTNILRDPTLRSPDDVKRAVRSYAYPIERSKSAPKVLPPLKSDSSSYMSTYVVRRMPSPSRKDPSLVRRGTISSALKAVTKTTPSNVKSKSQFSRLGEKSVTSTSKTITKTSSTVSLARTSSTFSVDSTVSKAKPIPKKPLTITRPSTRSETEKAKRKPVTITSSKSDSNVLRKIKESTEAKEKIIKAIPSQQKIVRTNHFFENLLMRDMAPNREWNTMSLPSKKSVRDSRYLSFHQCRSLSPPVKKPYVEEYESLEHFHSDEEVSEFGDRSGRTEDLVWQYEQRSRSEPRAKKTVSDIARPESPAPVFPRQFSPTREIRVPQTRDMRSPSRRRIQSFRSSQRGETEKVIRASSLSSADDRAQRSLYHCDDISQSANSLEYIERHSPTCRSKTSDRFIDLNRFYSTLERVGQLERATSDTSLKPIRKEGEPIDFEEWRRIRFHERAERELKYLVGKLKNDQKKKDFLFRPKDVEDVKWSQNKDLSLISKDKSVEDLRENFEKKIHQEWLDESKRLELESRKDTYKPYWRGSSVADLASSMEIKYNPDSGSFGIQKVKGDPTSSDKPLCLSNRLISTLSKDQVSKITQQLNEIYNASEPKSKPDVSEEYVMTVDKRTPSSGALKVRCNSTITKEELIGPVLRRKEASEKPTQSKSFERLSREVLRPETDLTESEKQKLSQSLSNEIRSRTRSGSPVYLARETRGAIAAENAKVTLPDIPPPPPLPKSLIETKKPAPEKPKRKTLEKTSREARDDELKVETVSTETLGKLDETVCKKIQYFETRKFEEPAKTIYHAREDSSPDEDEIMRIIEENIKARAESAKYHHQDLTSSTTDLKDLFGEKESSRLNFPLPQPPPPPDETIYYETKHDQNRSTSLTLTASRDASLENIEAHYRSRSVSPQSGGISYLHRVQTGEVRKIKDKFESLGRPKKSKHFFGISPLRKVRSDPELNNDGSKDTFKTVVQEHEVGDVSWITHKFEERSSASRGRSRFRKPASPIQRMPLRKEDRLMPHIDIISKTASLKQEMMKSRSPSPSRPQTSLHAGEVERIRCLFETSPDRDTSPIGRPRLGTSSPELRDISAHLTASWIAHKYPKPLDNDLRSPPVQEEKLEETISLPVVHEKRPQIHYRSRSISPPKSKMKPSTSPHTSASASAPTSAPAPAPVTSILKPRYDIFANQKFDPSVHRPKARYVPDAGNDAPKKTVTTTTTTTRKMTAVKFKDYDDDVPPPVPVPPTKGVSLDSNGFSNLESPNRYVESDVNIHYKTPIRYEYKDRIPDEELAIRQAESMQKLYQEERRRKYLQELQDMNSRRHTDNFTPSQKSPIPLNRYDDFNSDLAPKSPSTHSNYPRTVARALYNFQGQTPRELTFKKGDVIYIRRQIDKNWYEGEHNAMIGLLPSNYVEILPRDGNRQPPKKPSEGQARAKYNFQAQSGIELSLNKGELVTLTRRVDENWFEGKIANRKGIFPVTYVEVLVDIGAEDRAAAGANRVPASQSIINQQSSTAVRPSLDTLRTNINNEFNTLTSNGQHPNGILRETKSLHKTEVLHVDTNTEPVAYRAMYKYRPQNTDELELLEGDIVYVLEKCDDGWFVGTSQRTGCFGTFPGNYVERV